MGVQTESASRNDAGASTEIAAARAWRRFARWPRGPWSGIAHVAIVSITDRVGWRAPRPVGSAAAMLARGGDDDRLWVARESVPIGPASPMLADLSDRAGDQAKKTDGAYDSTPLHVRRLGTALLLTATGAVLPGSRRVFREAGWGRRGGRSTLSRNVPGLMASDDAGLRIDLAAAAPRRLVPGPALSLCHVFGHGYGHWLSDALPPVIAFLPEIRAGVLKLLAPPLLAWQRRGLEMLGVPAAAVVEVDDPTVLCDDLLVHSYGSGRHTSGLGPLIAEFFAALRAGAARPATGGPRLIYLSRRSYGGPRVLRNEAELESAVRALGFTIVAPEALDFDGQIALFANARMVAGPHGSGFANVGFAPAGCGVYDILPGAQRARWVHGLCANLGHHFAYARAPIDGDKVRSEWGSPKYDYRVDVETVVARLREAMRRLGIA